MRSIPAAYPEGGNIFTAQYLGPPVAWSMGEKYKVPNAAHMMFRNAEVIEHYDTVMKVLPGWRSELEKFRVIAMVLQPSDIATSRLFPLVPAIAHESGWRMVAHDEKALTFLKIKPGEAEPSPEERLAMLNTLWRTIYSIAQKDHYEKDVEGLKTMDRARQALRIIESDDQTTAEKLAALQRLIPEPPAR